MEVGTIADGILAGLGLFLLGAWLAQSGMAHATGARLRKALLERPLSRRRAWCLGAWLGLGMPASEESSRTAAGLVNTGLVGSRLALWSAAGHGAGVVLFAWLFACLPGGVVGSALAFALVAGGAAALWSAPDRTRGALGRALSGWGLMILGMVLLVEGFEQGRGHLELDSLAGGGFVRFAVLLVGGTALSAALRSGPAAVVLVSAAAGGGALTNVSALALGLGAALGASSGAATSFRKFTPAARRAAVGLFGSHGVAVLGGCVLVACALPLLADPPSLLSNTSVVLAIALTLSLVAPVGVLAASDQLIEVWLSGRFLADEHAAEQAKHVDASLSAAPELALPALAREANRQYTLARDLAADVVSRQPLSDRRDLDDRAAGNAIAEVVDEGVETLAQRTLAAPSATALPSIARATRAAWELSEQAGYLKHTELAQPGALGDGLESRLLRLQLDLAKLLRDADPAGPRFDPDGCESSLEALEGRVMAIRTHAVDRCVAGDFTAKELERAFELLFTLRRVGHLAVDTALDLDLALRGEDTLLQEPGIDPEASTGSEEPAPPEAEAPAPPVAAGAA